MKRVYLVICNAIQDCSDLGIGTYCYDSYEKAKKVFKEIVDDEKRAIDGLDWVIEESNDSFLAYEDGYYEENHTMVEIREMVIE